MKGMYPNFTMSHSPRMWQNPFYVRNFQRFLEETRESKRMRCDYYGGGRYGRCSEEAVGQATDKFGSNVYCEKHLSQLEEGIKRTRTTDTTIIRFSIVSK